MISNHAAFIPQMKNPQKFRLALKEDIFSGYATRTPVCCRKNYTFYLNYNTNNRDNIINDNIELDTSLHQFGKHQIENTFKDIMKNFI